MRNWGRTAEGEGVALTWDLAGLRGEGAAGSKLLAGSEGA